MFMSYLMKKDSIKTRLLLIVGICLLGMLVLVVNQIYNTHRLNSLHEQSKHLLQLSNELLQLRRHEKDFLLRLDPSYVQAFQIRADSVERHIAETKILLAKLSANDYLFDDLLGGFDAYKKSFIELVALQTAIGINENSGFQGDFRQATHTLEKQLKSNELAGLQIKLLQIRRNEKDFLLRKRMQYFEQEYQLYDSLRDNIASLKPQNYLLLLGLLDDYQLGFKQLVDAYQQMGLDHTLGIQGRFRLNAHVLERQVATLYDQLNVLIAKTEQQVERLSLVIMSTTSLALILILIKSYMTFQRAFLNFVMFFYRCKREYQHMDGKKLGFSEFKYLASIANEMIDAKKEVELKLQAAHKHISELEKTLEQPTAENRALG